MYRSSRSLGNPIITHAKDGTPVERLTNYASHQFVPRRIDANHKRVVHHVGVCQELAVTIKRPTENPL